MTTQLSQFPLDVNTYFALGRNPTGQRQTKTVPDLMLLKTATYPRKNELVVVSIASHKSTSTIDMVPPLGTSDEQSESINLVVSGFPTFSTGNAVYPHSSKKKYNVPIDILR